MSWPAARFRRAALGGGVLACALCSAGPLQAGNTGVVTGKVTAQGLRTSANVVLSLERDGLEVAAPAEPLQMDQKGLRFIPHVLPVVVGTTVRFLNNDPEPHNVYSPEGRYNLGTWPQGETRDYTFTRVGEFTQLCRIHPEMEAFIVAVATPYFGVSGADGAYAIADVPPGDYTLVAWSERLGRHEQPVSVKAGQTVSVDVTLTR